MFEEFSVKPVTRLRMIPTSTELYREREYFQRRSAADRPEEEKGFLVFGFLQV